MGAQHVSQKHVLVCPARCFSLNRAFIPTIFSQKCHGCCLSYPAVDCQVLKHSCTQHSPSLFPPSILTRLPSLTAPSSIEPLRPNEKVKFLQKMAKGNVDPMELFTRGVNSKGFQVLLKNVEIQHRILEEMPLLAAFDGFRQIMGRRLNDEQVCLSMSEGIRGVEGRRRTWREN